MSSPSLRTHDHVFVDAQILLTRPQPGELVLVDGRDLAEVEELFQVTTTVRQLDTGLSRTLGHDRVKRWKGPPK